MGKIQKSTAEENKSDINPNDKRTIFFRKLFLYLLIITLSLLAGLSVLATFLPGGERVFSHPLYFLPWGLLSVQIILYPFVLKTDSSATARFLLAHTPFVVLVFTVVLSLLTIREGEIQIKQGETVLLDEVLSETGIPVKERTEFSVRSGEVEGSDVRTGYLLKTGKESREGEISVNNHLRIGQIRLYQQSGGIGVREIRFLVNGKEYDFFDVKGQGIALPSGNRLFIIPAHLSGKGISYQLEIKDVNGNLIEEGFYAPGEEKNTLAPFSQIEILKEDYLFISVLRVVYAPLSVPLGIVSVLFLVLLAWRFWGKKR